MSVQSSPPARATQVNKEAVRLLALNIGVREAARQLGLNEDRVCKWSERGKWFSTTTHINAKNTPVSTVSSSPGDVLLRAIEADNVPTRAALAKAHRRAAEHAAQLRAEELMKPGTAQALKAHGQGAALTHGWEQKQIASNVMVNIALLGVDPGEVQAQATVLDNEQTG